MSNDRACGLRYLRKQAADAHRGGDVGAVRHLVAVALEPVSASREAEPYTLDDLAWAFVYGIYWMNDPNEVESFLLPCYQALHEKPAGYQQIMDYLFAIITGDGDSLQKHYQELLTVQLAKFAAEAEQYPDVLLLFMLTIETWWWLDRTSDKWLLLAHRWSDSLSETALLRQVLIATTARLQAQAQIVYSRTLTVQTDLPQSHLLLARAWRHFYDADWNALDALIPKLVDAFPFTSEYFLSAQGLINMTRYRRHAFDGKAVTGSRRYERALMSRPQGVIDELRLSTFDRQLGLVRQAPQGKGYTRAVLFRLAMMLEMSALRIWDLGAFLEVQGRIEQLNLDIGLYSWFQKEQVGNYGSYLVKGLAAGMRSLNQEKEHESQREIATHVLELTPNAPHHIESLADTCLQLQPVECPYAVEIIRHLGDAFPEHRLVSLSEWSASLSSLPQGGLARWDWSMLRFWVPIINHCEVPSQVWGNLAALVEGLAQTPWAWSLNPELLETFLSHAPGDQALKVVKTLISAQPEDPTDQNLRRAVLFNAALRNVSIRQEATRYLELLRSQAPDNFEVALDQSLLRDDTADSDNMHRHVLVENFREWCNKVKPAEKNAWTHYGISWDDFRRLSWKDARPEEVHDVLRSAEHVLGLKPVNQDLASASVQALIGIATTGRNTYGNLLGEFITRQIIEPPQLQEHPFDDGPFSSVALNFTVISIYFHRLVALAAIVYPYCQREHQRVIRRWAIQSLHSVEEANIPHLTRLFGYAALTTHGRQDGRAGLLVLGGTATSPAIAGKALNGIRLILKEPDVSRAKGTGRLKLLDQSGAVLGVIKRWILLAAQAPVPSARESVARFLSELTGVAEELDIDPSVHERLAKDVRASVRNALFTRPD